MKREDKKITELLRKVADLISGSLPGVVWLSPYGTEEYEAPDEHISFLYDAIIGKVKVGSELERSLKEACRVCGVKWGVYEAFSEMELLCVMEYLLENGWISIRTSFVGPVNDIIINTGKLSSLKVVANWILDHLEECKGKDIYIGFPYSLSYKYTWEEFEEDNFTFETLEKRLMDRLGS